jgi:dynein light chain Tctex-type 1
MTLGEDKERVLCLMQQCAEEAIQKSLDGKEYDDSLVESWCTEIASQILQVFKPRRTPQFKFIATCMILSRRSQNVNETQMALWDLHKDLRITTKWSNETMQCIVSIWAFKTRFP